MQYFICSCWETTLLSNESPIKRILCTSRHYWFGFVANQRARFLFRAPFQLNYPPFLISRWGIKAFLILREPPGFWLSSCSVLWSKAWSPVSPEVEPSSESTLIDLLPLPQETSVWPTCPHITSPVTDGRGDIQRIVAALREALLGSFSSGHFNN